MYADIQRYTAIFSRKMRADLNHSLEKYNLNDANFFYLTILAQSPGINQNYFSKSLGRDQSLVTKQINKLTKQGWITKKVSPTDRRNSELYLTPKAEAILTDLAEITQETSELSVAGLTRAERSEFKRLLKKAALTYAKPLLTDDPHR